MSDATSNLTIRIGSSGDFAALGQAKAQMEDLRIAAEGCRRVLESVGIVAGLGGFVEGISRISEMASSIVNLSNRLQISTDAFQILSEVARTTGLDSESMATILGKLRGTIDTAATSGGKAAEAFMDLGLNASELAKVPLEVALQAVAVQVTNATDKTKAYADAVVILGEKNLPKLNEMLKQLAHGGYDEAARSVTMLTSDELESVKQAKDAWKEFFEDFEKWSAKAGAAWLGGWQIIGGKVGDIYSAIKSGNPGAAAGTGLGLAGWDQPQTSAGASSPTAGNMSAVQQVIDASTQANSLAAQLKADEAEVSDQKKLQLSIEKELLIATTDHAKKVKELAEIQKKGDEDGLALERMMDEADIAAGDAQIKSLEQQEAEHQKLNAIALTAIDHDYTLTETEKWEAKRKVIEANVAELQAYIDKLNAIKNDEDQPDSVRSKAGAAAGKAGVALAGSQGQLANMGPDPTSFTQNFSKDLTNLRNQWGTLQQQMASGLTGVISTGLQSVEGNIQKVIMGTENWKKALTNIETTIESSLIGSFVQMGVKWVATQIMMAVEGKSIAAASTAAMTPIAAAEAEIWAGPATLATIASWGGAAAAAPEEVLGAMAATSAFAGFSEGGYTGSKGGIVHEEEFVFSAPAVRNIGLDNLTRAHTMAKAANFGGGGGQASGSGDHSVNLFHYQDQTAATQAALRHPGTRKIIADIAAGVVRQLA